MSDLTERLNSIQHRSPRLYTGMVATIAVAGVLLLALPPLLSLTFFISGLASLYNLFFSQSSIVYELSALLYQLPLAALFAYLSYRFISLQLELPYASEIYVSVNRKKTPKLIALIEELEQHFVTDQINNIIITDQYAISVHITPYNGFPVQGETSLQIGLPLMQTVSARHFKALLARRIGQLSFKTGKITNTFYFFRDILSQYLRACQQQAHWSLKPFYYFLDVYIPFFKAISFYTSRMDELNNDGYATEIVDDKSFAQALSQTIIASHYLKNTFWMSMYKLQRQYPHKTIFPHANMTVSFTQSIKPAESKKLLDEHFQKLSDFRMATPVLRSRLEKLGHETYSLPLPLENTAAIVYLDTALPRITKIFDTLWLQKLQIQREQSVSANSNELRLNALIRKISEQALSAEETWELATLTEKIKGYHAAIPIYKKIIERNPMHAKAMFAVGRILLSFNDATGISAIEKAVFLEPDMKKTADELVARYQARIAAEKNQADELIA